MKSKKAKLVKSIIGNIFWLVIGLALCAASFLLPALNGEPYFKWIVLGVGVLIIILSIIAMAVCKNKIKRLSTVATAEAEINNTSKKSIKVRQTKEQKLAQIDLMDSTQFTMFVARLYQSKGYRVGFAPVADNYGVSFIAEKQGVSCAVICIWASNTLTANYLEAYGIDWKRYSCKSATLITNSLLDKSAKRFVKNNKIDLIDRKELKNQLS